MRVHVDALGTFSRTAQEGAERAAENLTGMTGIETGVDVTKVTLVPSGDLAADQRRVGVVVDFDGGLAGTSVLTIPPAGVETMLDSLLSGDDLHRSAVTEVGNLVTCGFLDAWADHLGTTIEVSPPRYVEDVAESGIGRPGDGDGGTDDRDRAVVVRSRVSAVGEELDVTFRTFPDPDSMGEMLAGGDETGIPVGKLTTLREMARSGAETASESVTAMTGIDTTVDVPTLSFVPVEDVPGELADEQYVGTVFAFEGTTDGYLLVMFDEPSAREVVSALVPGADPDAGVDSFDGMEESAIRELGNVMTSSFVDGWANVLDATIDISTPQFVHDSGRAVANSVVARIGHRQAFAFLFDATIRADDRAFDCELYAVPDESDLRAMLADLEEGATAERTTRAGSL